LDPIYKKDTAYIYIGKMIDSYNFGRVVIDGKLYTKDVIIIPGRVKDNWWRKSGHQLCIEDIEEEVEKGIEVIIIGTGYSGVMRVLPETMEYLQSRGIEVIVKRTKDACEIYNQLENNKKVIACLHLTC
jgi:hypothetical protein